MNDCQIDADTLACVVCGRPATSPLIRRNCRPGLGDMVAAGLSAVGITKERVEAVVGGPCGCDQRREALNRLGRSFGVGG